ncbi:PIG-L deacetylase family protein [Rhodanobacter sp. Col0626]|uniref:PIG-L deacetylase family protein n=1 Tax=Rhodanobacter sp. Col0626 TaxID=3415679 RepID=UPI003CEE0BF3
MALSNADNHAVTASVMPAFSTQTRLLVVAPHPDDETIATGVLIQQVLAAGGEVRILLLTAGDNNPWPQRWLERRVILRAVDRQRWGRRRYAEMLRALQCLDVPVQALQPQGWSDMGITDALLRDDTALLALSAAIAEFRPTLVTAPALSDRHPDHGATHVLVRLALARQADVPPLLAYLVHGHAAAGDRPIEAHGTAAQSANKLLALAAHRSQMALSGKRLIRLAARPECYAGVATSPVGGATALPWQPSAWLRPWLRLSVVSPGGARSWRWRDAPLQRDSAGRFHLSPQPGLTSPCFARLALTLRSPWIFDYWGWCELTRPSGRADAGLARGD